MADLKLTDLQVKGEPCPICGIDAPSDEYGCLTLSCEGPGGDSRRPASPADILEVAATLPGAEKVRWCVVHNAESIEDHGGSSDECWPVVWLEGEEATALPSGFCRIVERLVIPLEDS